MAFTVNRHYRGYGNTRVTQDVDGLSEAEVRFLKFYPLYDDGYLIVMVATKDEEGAVELNHSASGNSCTVNLRAALLGFNLEFTGKRKRTNTRTKTPTA